MPARFKVLWVAFIFPPYGGTEGLRMRKYLEHLDRLSGGEADVDVLTIRPEGMFPQYDSALAEGLASERLRIHRVFAGICHRIRYACFVDDQSRWGRGWRKVAAQVIVFFSNLGWVPFAILWLLWRRFLSGRGRFQAVYTFVDPFSSLVVGLAAKILNGSRWVVEYGDPWRIKPATGARSGLARLAGAFVERRALARADRIIARTPSVIEGYREAYPRVPAERYMDLYGGVECEEYDRVEAKPPADRFVICHTGTLYGDSVSPLPFLEAVRVLRTGGRGRIEVVLAGARNAELDQAARDLGIEDSVTATGHRPFAEVMAMQKSAALLAAFGCRTPHKIPSKIAQYMAARRPILVVSEIDGDPSARLVQQHRRGIAVENSSHAIAAALAALYDQWRQGRLEERFEFAPVNEITYGHLARRILDALHPAS